MIKQLLSHSLFLVLYNYNLASVDSTLRGYTNSSPVFSLIMHDNDSSLYFLVGYTNSSPMSSLSMS